MQTPEDEKELYDALHTADPHLKPRKRGRPKGSVANSHMVALRLALEKIIPQIENQLRQSTETHDPSAADRNLTLISRIQWARALVAPDSEIALADKANLASRIIAQLEGTKSTLWTKNESSEPRTLEELAKAREKSSRNISNILRFVEPPKETASGDGNGRPQ